jgi:hypothetical protein
MRKKKAKKASSKVGRVPPSRKKALFALSYSSEGSPVLDVM